MAVIFAVFHIVVPPFPNVYERQKNKQIKRPSVSRYYGTCYRMSLDILNICPSFGRLSVSSDVCPIAESVCLPSVHHPTNQIRRLSVIVKWDMALRHIYTIPFSISKICIDFCILYLYMLFSSTVDDIDIAWQEYKSFLFRTKLYFWFWDFV